MRAGSVKERSPSTALRCQALELVGAWMAGNALPTAVEARVPVGVPEFPTLDAAQNFRAEVPLPLQSPAPEEAEAALGKLVSILLALESTVFWA